MSDTLISALGAKNEHEAVRAIAQANEFMASVKAATGVETFTENLAIIVASISLSREIVGITGKPDAESIGTVLAWKMANEQNPGLQARVTELEEEGRSRDVDALIKMALSTEAPSEENPYAGKLTKPLAAKMRDEFKFTAAQMKSFLDAKSRELPMPAKPGASSSAVSTVKNAAGRAADGQGRTYELIPPTERVSLKKADPDLFNALRDDWLAAGSPADVTAPAN